ncbi:unnamed protein product [Rotaria sp. Silwood1]|nr:unnamed protein product [Rotaria sp. Silwood1]
MQRYNGERKENNRLDTRQERKKTSHSCGPLTNDGLTPRRPPPLHSSTVNNHQRYLSTTQTNETLEDISETGGGLLLRLQRRLKQL